MAPGQPIENTMTQYKLNNLNDLAKAGVIDADRHIVKDVAVSDVTSKQAAIEFHRLLYPDGDLKFWTEAVTHIHTEGSQPKILLESGDNCELCLFYRTVNHWMEFKARCGNYGMEPGKRISISPNPEIRFLHGFGKILDLYEQLDDADEGDVVHIEQYNALRAELWIIDMFFPHAWEI